MGTLGGSDQIAFLFERLHILEVTRMVDVAASTIFVWDYLMTIGMEIEYVWPGKWTTMKVVYLLQRYLPFIDTVWLQLHQIFATNLSPSTCHILTTTSRSLMYIGLALSEMILTFRAWAVWNCHRVLTILLPILFIGCWAPHLAFLVEILKSLEYATPPIPQFIGCFAVKASSNTVISWILLMVWDTVIFVLMVIPAIKTFRFRGQSALYTTVYAEAMSVINIVLLRLESVDIGYRFILVVMARCMHSILTSRALLHIRARIYQPLHEEALYSEDHDHRDTIRTIKSRGL
ncbi:hypothetical protein NLJ89_g5060 [Agrocybe chaxingu]|uniref:DUF6533 domain-containing protein n=1 Tax=Agrocybe chaxingu TaxID=84603 RepID=A0A9W8MVY7_9AGAR|nr:hypothetical protein NLJ89_g5060 [Agrocybe chaxingu]